MPYWLVSQILGLFIGISKSLLSDRKSIPGNNGHDGRKRCRNIYRNIGFVAITVLIYGGPLSSPLFSQTQSQKFLIRQISFEGNNRTQSSRLLREVVVNVGDSLTLKQVTQKLKESKEHLINTGLFTDVSTNLFFDEENPNNIRLHFLVKEGLFFIPIPIIELADRNFNVWWTEHNRDIKFLNLGMNLKLRNITGNADELAVLGQWGYDRKFIVNYLSPYFDQDRQWNINFRTYYNSNKELIYHTLNGEPKYMRNDDEYLRSKFETSLALIYRPRHNSWYRLSLGYFFNTITDEVMEVNPRYFNGDDQQRYGKISLEYSFDNRDNKYLSTDGWFLHGLLAKNGISNSDQLNSWELEADIYYYHLINDHWSWSNGILFRGHDSPDPFPYSNLYQLGSNPEYIRGYEYYHIEGSSLGVYKTSLMRKIIDRKINWGKAMPFTNYRSMDAKLFLSLNLDLGYVLDDFYRTSSFVNNDLWGGGLGLNLLLYNKFSCSFEASINQKKEVGFFFHLNQNF